ncbi:hypothetical protein RC86_10040 [Pectobacterium brasiliense]|uniref:hypothetical protein n=1 Tax=Pectobacterium brasiliense TaxID=180957 RepID=UPI0005803CBF|nr:hypothetical protein [Pectobacterium brasiliense]KHS91382.1 hypothetical protein RC86_10040 [Pectobacterium brasiliense]
MAGFTSDTEQYLQRVKGDKNTGHQGIPPEIQCLYLEFIVALCAEKKSQAMKEILFHLKIITNIPQMKVSHGN